MKGLGLGVAFADQKGIKKGQQLKAITATNNQGNWASQTWLSGNKSFFLKKSISKNT